MNITKAIEIHEESLLIKKTKTLIIGDLHLGQESTMNSAGFLVPINQYKQIKTKLKKIIEETKPRKIILNGDLKHEFGRISRQEWKHITELLDYLHETAQIIVIEGNHDKILAPLLQKKGIRIKTSHFEEDIYITHGDILPKNKNYEKAKTIIIGHEHPAIGLKRGERVEFYKCFLKGKQKKKTIIVMPSFNPISEGSDILKEKLLSPFLKEQNLRSYEAYIIGETQIYEFGKLKDLKKYNF